MSSGILHVYSKNILETFRAISKNPSQIFFFLKMFTNYFTQFYRAFCKFSTSVQKVFCTKKVFVYTLSHCSIFIFFIFTLLNFFIVASLKKREKKKFIFHDDHFHSDLIPDRADRQRRILIHVDRSVTKKRPLFFFFFHPSTSSAITICSTCKTIHEVPRKSKRIALRGTSPLFPDPYHPRAWGYFYPPPPAPPSPSHCPVDKKG